MLAGGEEDGGFGGPEGGGAVVHVVLAVVVGYVWGPEVFGTAGVGGCPLQREGRVSYIP